MVQYLKIAFDAKRALHNSRGLGNYSRTLIKGLCEFYSEHSYFLYTPPSEKSDLKSWAESLVSEKFHIKGPENILGKIFPSIWRSGFLANRLSVDNPDIYHGLSHEIPYGINRTSIKTVVTIHDLIFMRFPEFFPLIDRFVYKRKYSYSIKNADLIIAICEQTKRDIIDFFNVEEDRVRVVYQSCNNIFYDKLLPDSKSAAKLKHSLPDRYILYVGAIEPNKNILGIVEAFNIIHKTEQRLDDLKLVILGRGRDEYKSLLVSKIREYSLIDKIIFLSGIDTLDLPGIYQNASLFMFPSFYEGFGIPIIEALVSSVPVITTKGGCFTESGGPSSCYVNPSDYQEMASAAINILSNVNLRDKMILDGKLFVSKFKLENTTRNLMEAYLSLIS